MENLLSGCSKRTSISRSVFWNDYCSNFPWIELPESTHAFKKAIPFLRMNGGDRQVYFYANTTGILPFHTVEDTIKDLPPIENGVRLEEAPLNNPTSILQLSLRTPNGIAPQHSVRSHGLKVMGIFLLEIFSIIRKNSLYSREWKLERCSRKPSIRKWEKFESGFQKAFLERGFQHDNNADKSIKRYRNSSRST